MDFGLPEVETFHRQWDLGAERERINRTRFAQRALKPDEVRRELEATDAVLGDEAAVRDFVLSAAQRLGLAISAEKREGIFRVATGPSATASLPSAVAFAIPNDSNHWLISFASPTPEGAEYLGRNHRFVAALARFLMEESLTKGPAATTSRCGVIRTRAVNRLTTILLLRVRYLLQQPDRAPLLSEEVHVTGFATAAKRGELSWLADDEAMQLLAKAKADANIGMPEKRELVQAALDQWSALQAPLKERINQRAADLEKSHKRVRQAVSLKVRQLNVKPQLPPDLVGILLLQPMV